MYDNPHLIGEWIESFVQWLASNGGFFFDGLSNLITFAVTGVHQSILWIPFWAWLILLSTLGFWRIGFAFSCFCATALYYVFGVGLWKEACETVAVVFVASGFCSLVGIPMGICLAKSQFAQKILNPILDMMQTLPAFVYLIPAVMLFGLGEVPGTIATVIFALPPITRLTFLGLSQIPQELQEMAESYGCSPWQKLIYVELPLAKQSILSGLNQTQLLALSMVVITSMIGGGGLGNSVLKGIQRMEIGLGFEAGICVVFVAIIIDRLSQSFITHQSEHGHET